jgi:hypothetical protein
MARAFCFDWDLCLGRQYLNRGDVGESDSLIWISRTKEAKGTFQFLNLFSSGAYDPIVLHCATIDEELSHSKVDLRCYQWDVCMHIEE